MEEFFHGILLEKNSSNFPMDKIKFISLIIPAYKQEKTIIDNLKNLDKALSPLSYKYEIIVVVDGFLDKTFEKAKSIDNKNIKVLGYEKNNGKGYAVKYGMLRAKGDLVGFIDAGMDINPVAMSLLLNIMVFNDADIVVGSKLHPESKVNYPFSRKILSWGYRNLTHIIFGFNVRDTQVGLKFFRKKVAKDVFPRVAVKKFAFDVEVLAVAKARGFTKIYEGPIQLNFSGASSITSTNFWKVIFSMLWDTAAVFYRLKILHYYDKQRKSI